jgi:hypothetical protein
VGGPALRRSIFAVALVLDLLAITGSALGSGSSVIDQVSPLVWVMIAISAGGATITYGFLVYALWKFRDPSTRRRNYG